MTNKLLEILKSNDGENVPKENGIAFLRHVLPTSRVAHDHTLTQCMCGRYAQGGKGHTADFYTRSNQLKVCDAVKKERKVVCSKEIRFLGHTAQLLRTASERKIPFTLIYQMRDPRASVLSQVRDSFHFDVSKAGSKSKCLDTGEWR